MKNVYDDIQAFYNASIEWDFVIPKPLLEGYLRQKAWMGYTDTNLKDIWDIVGWFINYLIYADIEDLDEITVNEYIQAILWIADNNSKFILNQQSLSDFLKVLIDFYSYLAAKKTLTNTKALSQVEDHFMNNGVFILPKLSNDDIIFHEGFTEDELLLSDVSYKLNLLLGKLLNKIGMYFKQEEFLYDFNRAISLYTGPFNTIPEDESEDFWLGFWDYFLFDYHLILSDNIPIKHFYLLEKKNLTHDEIHILEDLLKAKFTVFYIERIINQSTVECINLFNGEKIQLPIPDYGINDYKKVILYGHIYAHGVVMLNYITSIPVSIKFRHRIREEIIRQKNVYKVQYTDATMEDFFERHAILVRHTIDILVTLAKVNVMPVELFEKQFPIIENEDQADSRVTELLTELAKKYNFGQNAKTLLLKICREYSFLTNIAVIKPEVVAGTIFYCFAEINGISIVKIKDVLKKIKLSQTDFQMQYENIFNVLQLKMFDPRYLTEEGFILSLYSF
ncbi:MAG: hypothetical protein K0Q53_2479 [Massilibacillus sp.]|nr:hypothetical protein [Massilibacillus sp.]